MPETPGGIGAGVGENTLEDSVPLLFTVDLSQRDHHFGGDGCRGRRNGWCQLGGLTQRAGSLEAQVQTSSATNPLFHLGRSRPYPK